MVVNVIVHSGHPTAVLSDAIIAFVSPTSPWVSAVDEVIKTSYGMSHHSQLEANMPLRDKQVVYTSVDAPSHHLTSSVLFMVDDQTRTLSQLVTDVLQEADARKLKWVTLGFPETRQTASLYRPLGLTYIAELEAAIQAFVKRKPKHLYCIKLFRREGYSFPHFSRP